MAVVVVFNIVTCDLDVANFTVQNLDARKFVVANVTAGDDELVEVDVIEENAHTAVVVDMAMANQYIACAFSEVHTVAEFS